MNITITFDNFNGGLEEGIRVYRDNAPIADGALPAPLASLPPGTTQYLDGTAVRGSKYYYRFGVFSGTDELISPNKAVLAVAPNDTGPGPNTIVAGDWDLGYFGYCKSADFLSYGALFGLLGIAAGGSAALTDVGWIKVAYKGKVLYIARSTARYAQTFNSLYQAGAVYGTNDNGPVVPTGAVATNQYKPQTVGAYTFIPRILKGMPDSSALPASKADKDAVQLASHEFDDIMGMFFDAPRSNSDTKYGLFGRLDEIAYLFSSSWMMEWVQSQVGWAPGQAVGRGVRPGNVYNVRLATISVTTPALDYGTITYPGVGNVTFYPSWRPVMELVM